MRIDRRGTAHGLLAASALVCAGGLPVRAANALSRPATGPVEPLERRAGAWSTWVLRSGGELRPPPPPTGAAAGAELAELKALAAQRDAAAADCIAYWDAGAPGYRWNELATARAIRAPVAVRGYRTLALVNVAIQDATVAAWAAKYAINRPRPAEADPSLATALPTPPSPSYPAEHAAAAGAAAAVLAHLFPDGAADFAALAEEAGRSRLLAGVQYPSD